MARSAQCGLRRLRGGYGVAASYFLGHPRPAGGYGTPRPGNPVSQHHRLPARIRRGHQAGVCTAHRVLQRPGHKPDAARPAALGRILADEAEHVNPLRATPYHPPTTVSPMALSSRQEHTTHFVIADGEGNVVSATQTLGN